MKDIQIHPAANAFPMMDDARYDDLLKDIEEHGQRVAITLCEGAVLDGRNRLKAIQEIGLRAITTEFTGDPWAYVWSLNGTRRDLVGEQRYLIWRELSSKSEEWQTAQQAIKDAGNVKRSDAAAGNDNAAKERKNSAATDSGTTVSPEPSRSSNAKAEASKTNRGAVERGDRLATQRPDLAEKVRQGDMKPAEAHRQMRKDVVSENVAGLPTDKYTVIYADPPWSYNDKQSGSISESYGAAEKHYPSMSLSDLSALDIPACCAPDSVLFLWATSPLLPEALELSRAWGFKYKASFVWDKIKHNMGHYNSVRHEFLLICTKGSCTPHHVKLFDSVQSIERAEHSAKPEAFREIIETLYPSVKKLELFRRGTTPEGWDAWGNEHV